MEYGARTLIYTLLRRAFIHSLIIVSKGCDMAVLKTARLLSLRVDIGIQLDYDPYQDVLRSEYCMTHWISEKLSAPVQTSRCGFDGDDAYDRILAEEFLIEKGRIK